MAKQSSFGLGTVVAAAAGVVAGAVGMFLSDKENRQMVVKEAKKVERVIEKDLTVARRSVKKAGTKVKAAVKKAGAKKPAKKTTKKARRK